jgi:adenylosuccinate synthase
MLIHNNIKAIPKNFSTTIWTKEDKIIIAQLLKNGVSYIIRYTNKSDKGYEIIGSDSACVHTLEGIDGQITDFLRVIKPYSEKSGNGQFLTEFSNELYSFFLLTKNKSDTARFGWLDTVELQNSLNSHKKITGLIMTDLNAMTAIDHIQVCVAYYDIKANKNNTETICTPYYHIASGWKYDISKCDDVKKLPQQAKSLISFIQGFLLEFVYIIVVNEEPDGIITVKNPFNDYRPPVDIFRP